MTEPDRVSVETLLASAATSVALPDAAAFSRQVGERLRSRSVSVPVRRRDRRPILAFGFGLALVCAMTATLVPPVRSAVADLLGVDGVRITRAAPPPPTSPPLPSPPQPTTTSTVPADPIGALGLGQVTTLPAAARIAGFAMRVPTTSAFQHPDAVYVGEPGTAPVVSLVYLPRADRPAVDGTGIGGLLGEFRGRVEAGYFSKLAAMGTTIETVRVGAVDGFWLSGSPHQFFYVRPDGTVDSQTIRLAGNTLLWSAGGITYRFESGLTRDTAVAVADSMR